MPDEFTLLTLYQIKKYFFPIFWREVGRLPLFLNPSLSKYGLRNLAVMRHQPQPGNDFLYYSSEPVKGTYNFPGSIANKKWPLKKVH